MSGRKTAPACCSHSPARCRAAYPRSCGEWPTEPRSRASRAARRRRRCGSLRSERKQHVHARRRRASRASGGTKQMPCGKICHGRQQSNVNGLCFARERCWFETRTRGKQLNTFYMPRSKTLVLNKSTHRSYSKYHSVGKLSLRPAPTFNEVETLPLVDLLRWLRAKVGGIRG